MSLGLIFLFLIPVLFSIIHFVEFSSFLFRIAGLRINAKVTGYSIQQIAFVITRFFFVAMMPMIGFVVDKKVESSAYLLMIHVSLGGALFFYLVVFIGLDFFVSRFTAVVSMYARDGLMLRSLGMLFRKHEAPEDRKKSIKVFDYLKWSRDGRKIFWLSSVIFGCYAVAVFLSFYLALQFYEYRSSIGQMSGLINALATVLLSFIVEPSLSRTIDRGHDGAEEMVCSMLLGRLVGVGLLAQIVIGLVWVTVQ